jgi:hypothetical protein
MKAIFALILAAIFVYIGVNLLPGLNTTIGTITTTAGYSSGVVGMVAVIMIVFTAMIIFGVIAAMKDSFNG